MKVGHETNVPGSATRAEDGARLSYTSMAERTVCDGVTVTPISRAVVKMQSNFFGSASCQSFSWSLPAAAFVPRPFLRLMAASASRIAPDTHKDQASARVRPAPWRHTARVGTVPYPKEFHRTVAAGRPAPISGWLTVRAIRCHCGW
jgi:hypothetical protein